MASTKDHDLMSIIMEIILEKGCGLNADNLTWRQGVWFHADNLLWSQEVWFQWRGVVSC